ncbi:unnamed protein product [Vitrella brassicaformis CCMP3155]|uniref:PAS domain-containing protein n=1 Tax=Vitrella brassicaformis (strain CCMP3155) TaxID=1169540 RepID=A0A0G4FD41_VITBC|nr:unnamed protein product [Vitrella brassicaformis CCMP3155]|mmetsp:Transcript_15528/g.44392  ORF Transcript_15528/g.44392 Transcript_15528/m.44392 type:complete len:328 (-) Transcript_15528:323-1306(-)|eukprot:CEM11163.1 unnamed protein product [Vitrella brassicaformis CCMP3155]
MMREPQVAPLSAAAAASTEAPGTELQEDKADEAEQQEACQDPKLNTNKRPRLSTPQQMHPTCGKIASNIVPPFLAHPYHHAPGAQAAASAAAAAAAASILPPEIFGMHPMGGLVSEAENVLVVAALAEERRKNQQLRARVRELEGQVEELKQRLHMMMSSRSRDDQAIEEATKRFQSLHFSTVLCDLTMRDCPMVAVSKGFCELTGYEPWQLIGVNCRLLQCDQTSTETVREIHDYVDRLKNATTVQMHEDLVVTILNQRRDKSTFTNLLHISPIFLGGKLYLIGVQSDVTGCKDDIDTHNKTTKTLIREVIKQLFEAGIPQSELCI